MKLQEKESKTNIYEEIKERLSGCTSAEEFEEAYKWLAEQFVMVNESAIRFEQKVLDRYGEKELGVLIYGSEEAYERNAEMERRLQNASPQEREMIFLERVMNDDLCLDPEYPELW